MGTHPIFESDFDCLTDVKTDKLSDYESVAQPAASFGRPI